MGKNERTKEILNSIVNNNNSAVYQRQQVYKLASINLPSLKFKKLIARKKKKIFCKFIESSFMRDKSSKKKRQSPKTNKQQIYTPNSQTPSYLDGSLELIKCLFFQILCFFTFTTPHYHTSFLCIYLQLLLHHCRKCFKPLATLTP